MKATALLLGSMLALSGMTVGFSSIPPVFSHPKRHKKPPVVEKAAEQAVEPDAGPSGSPAADLADSSAVGKAVQDALDASAAKTEQRLIKAISRTVADDPTPTPSPAPGPTPPPTPPPPEQPFLELPAQVDGDVGDFIEITAKTNCKRVKWIVIDKGLKKFPDSALADPHSTVVSSLIPQSYRLAAVAAFDDDIVGPIETMVVVHGAQPPPPPPNPGPQPNPGPAPAPNPPPPPPNPTASKLFVVIVDNISARDPRTTAIIANNAFWGNFRSQGNYFLNVNTTDADAAKYKQMVDANGGVPAIILLDATNYTQGQTSLKWLNKNPADLRLPTTIDGVQALINRYSGRS